MKIVLEGTDGVGKSTLANDLSSHSGYGIYHSTSKTQNDFKYHEKLITKEGLIVYDRFHLGEIVWPIIFGRDPKMSYEEIIEISKLADIIIIYYASDETIIIDRLCGRGESRDQIDNSLKANRIYKYLIESLPLDNILAIDISKDDVVEKTKHLYFTGGK